MTRQTLQSLVRALVVSKVDYCNSVLTGVSAHLLDRLQSVLSAVVRLIFSARRSEHIGPLLRELHWLHVLERIRFRLCVLAFRCLHGTAPSYLAGSLCHAANVDGRRHLHLANTVSLVVPSTQCTTLGDRAFPVAAARAWNDLPPTITASPSLLTFCQHLKTFCFQTTFH